MKERNRVEKESGTWEREKERKICLVHASATLRDSDQLFAIEPELLGQ